MVNIKNIAFLALTAVSCGCHASNDDVINKVMKYFEVNGLSEMTKNAHQECISMSSKLKLDVGAFLNRIFVESQTDVVLSDIEITNLRLRLEQEQQGFIEQQCKEIEPDKELRIIAEEYSKHVSSDDVDALIYFAKSPLGQKDINASKKSLDAAYPKIWELRVSRLKEAGDKFAIVVHNTFMEFIREKGKK